MSDSNEFSLPQITEITDTVIELVDGAKRLFPSVVIEITDRLLEADTNLDRLETMRHVRDELIERLGQCAIVKPEVVE